MDRITPPPLPSPAESNLTLSLQASPSALSSSSNAPQKTSPHFRQSEPKPSPLPPVPAHEAGTITRQKAVSVSLKRRVKEKPAMPVLPGALSPTLRSMRAKVLIDLLMHFDLVGHEGTTLRWDQWLISHGVIHPLILELEQQANALTMLARVLASSTGGHAHGPSEPASLSGDSKQRRLLCTHLLRGVVLSHSPLAPDAENAAMCDEFKARAQQQAEFFAAAAREAQPDFSKPLAYQLPKVLGSAIWPERFDEKKLQASLEAMGLFGVIAGLLCDVIRAARQARSDPPGNLQEAAQVLLRQSCHQALDRLAADVFTHTEAALSAELDRSKLPLPDGQHMHQHLAVLFNGQLDVIRRVFGSTPVPGNEKAGIRAD